MVLTHYNIIEAMQTHIYILFVRTKTNKSRAYVYVVCAFTEFFVDFQAERVWRVRGRLFSRSHPTARVL